MNHADLAKWNNERRWDYIHAVLSLDAINPLYDYIGIPFQDEQILPFQTLLRDYYTEVYRSANIPPASLQEKRDRLCRRIEETFGIEFRDAYISWLIHIFIYLPEDQARGWDEWRSIFTRSSVRAGWWSRLGLPADKDEAIRLDFEDAKMRMEDARDIRRSVADKPRSDWDRSVMLERGMDEESVACGQPYSAVMLTAGFFMFYCFWEQMMERLTAQEVDQLWSHARTLAPEVDDIVPASVLHPRGLMLEEWWTVSQANDRG